MYSLPSKKSFHYAILSMMLAKMGSLVVRITLLHALVHCASCHHINCATMTGGEVQSILHRNYRFLNPCEKDYC